jgi:hypothetical protein
LDNGEIQMYTAPSVSADANQTFSTVMYIDNSGNVPIPTQPAFQVRKSGYQSDIGGSHETVTWDTEVFDIGSNFASNTFTAPVTGKYQFNVTARLQGVDSAASYLQLQFITSNRQYEAFILDPSEFNGDLNYFTFVGGMLADMDASDTCVIQIQINSGAAQTDIVGTTANVFSGCLLA